MQRLPLRFDTNTMIQTLLLRNVLTYSKDCLIFIWYQLFNLSIPFLSPFPIPMNGHKQKPTIAPLSIYARNTLCLPQLSIYFFHPFYPTLLFQTTIVDRYKLQIRSDRTVRFLDFHQTDFNVFAGVGISTSCFCSNYHNFLIPFHAQVIGSNYVSTTSHRSFF